MTSGSSEFRQRAAAARSAAATTRQPMVRLMQKKAAARWDMVADSLERGTLHPAARLFG